MQYEDFAKQVHDRMLSLRALDAFVTSPRFERAFDEAAPHHKQALEMILKSEDVDALRQWAADRLAGPYGEWSYRQLRDKAKELNIPRWSRLDRDELQLALEEYDATSV